MLLLASFTVSGGPRVPQRNLLSPKTAVAASFHWFDRWWADARCDPAFTEHGWDDSGSTAVVGMVFDQQLVVGNAGGHVGLSNCMAAFVMNESHALGVVLS